MGESGGRRARKARGRRIIPGIIYLVKELIFCFTCNGKIMKKFI